MTPKCRIAVLQITTVLCIIYSFLKKKIITLKERLKDITISSLRNRSFHLIMKSLILKKSDTNTSYEKKSIDTNT